jgi:site-specific DNA-methyltransferase (adenine-specific)
VVEPLEIYVLPIKELTPDPNNARIHKRKSLDALCESLSTFGQRKPILITKDKVVIAGNGTLAAAQILEWETINCTYVPSEWTQQQITAYALADNATAELSTWDEDLLQVQLEGLKDLEANLGVLGLPKVKTNLDDIKEAEDFDENKVKVQAGQLWMLGNNKLLCGDANNVNSYNRLLGEDKADCVWTDPPYGVAYVGKTADALTIENDNLSIPEMAAFLTSIFNLVVDATKPGAAWYVAAPHGRVGLAFSQALDALDVWRHSLVWVKNTLVMGRADYHYKHEVIYYGWTPGGPHKWTGDRKQDTLFHFDKPARSEEHPTMKPVALIAAMIANSTAPDDVILDPFIGSGSTLLAAEQLGRRCYGIDIEPKYCAATITRWQNLTGEKAVLLDG